MSKEKTTQAKERPDPASAELPSEGRSPETRERASEGRAPAASPAVKRILLVDDDGEIIEAIKFALENKGYEVLVARD